ncbi:MAG: threonylcarbamoyl-AMP synthase [Sphingobacteriia bacterium]|nr:MAG: threonylcarbamoyl-AMP synthase [Sphingobacteriia bacterium]
MTTIGTDLQKAVALLIANELVAIPTETVYGLAGNALSEVAVSKIYAAKNRPSFNPLILHVKNIDEINRYAEADIHSLIIAKVLMPGPITLLLPKKNTVPDITTAGSNKVAIRIPNHPLTLALLEQINFPLAAPSANPSGYISPTSANHVYDGLEGKIGYVLDGGPTSVGLESTICEVMGDHILLHRVGGISAAQLTDLTGLEVKYTALPTIPQTPGQLKSHYAPNTPLFRGNIEQLIQEHQGKKIAIISLSKDFSDDNVNCFCLSSKGDLSEAANQLFATLRKIDLGNYEVILAEVFPESGIGIAINDRIERAQYILK